MRTLCLAMIVRDEAAVIGRCLRSARPLISSWVIVDTGSQDDTIALARRALDGLPGELHERPWRDFGANRSELMELAHGAADYLLLLDADVTVKQTAPLPELTADAYLVSHDLVETAVRRASDWAHDEPDDVALSRLLSRDGVSPIGLLRQDVFLGDPPEAIDRSTSMLPPARPDKRRHGHGARPRSPAVAVSSTALSR